MNVLVEPGLEGPVNDTAGLFSRHWADLDDEALLAHFRSPRPVHVDLVVDAEECTPQRLDALMAGRFEFNGETHALPDPIDWLRNPSDDVEWHILLHKFYYAAGLGQRYQATGDAACARRWADLIDSWMQQTPVGFIAADVTGRRVQNWIYSTRAFVAHGVRHVAPVDAGFFRRMLESLHAQVEFLCANLTPKRNHRTLELYAIFLAGVAFPEMARAAHWRAFAMEQTLVNMRADLLPDGVHCELSTDYHHLAVRNWLHVRTLAVRHGVPVPGEMDALLEHALNFALHVHKPDGKIPSLSDGDVRSFLPLLAQGAELFRRDDMRWVATQGLRGTPPCETLMHFRDSGYTVVRSHWGTGPQDFRDAQFLVLDSGPLGEGNHGHFDALSFELAAHGRSLVVDPGRYTYSEAGDINWRVRFRGTSAHNTVCVDGRHQTRYAPKPVKEASRHAQGSVRHRIGGPAPDTALLELAQAPGLTLLQARAASHEYDAVHERTVVFVDQRYWIVSDVLRAPTPHEYTLNFQLHEGAQGRATLAREGAWRMDCPGLTMLVADHPEQRVSLAESWVSQRYGHKAAAPALRAQVQADTLRFDTVLLPWADAAPAARLERESCVSADGRQGHQVQVHLEVAGAPVVDTWFHGEAEGAWRVDGLLFRGRWLYLRRAADGTVLRAVAHEGARLQGRGPTMPLAHPVRAERV